jgi:pilus assembly protein CpaF
VSQFDISTFLAEQKQAQETKLSSLRKNQFRELLERFDQDQEESLLRMTEEQKEEHLKLQHEAIIGVPASVKKLKDLIAHFISTNKLSDIEYPSFYKTITEAVFHERYGMGPLSTWYNHANSQAAQVIGTDIYYEIEGRKILQKVKFDSLAKVEDICRALTMKDATSRLNERNPSLEVDMYDGTRATITIPPLTQVPTITLRHFIVSDFSLEFQASKGTIPADSIPLFRALARTRPNIIVSGPVRSGKSTFLKTLYAERDEADTCICIETHFELFLKRDFPKRAVIEFQAKETDLTHKVFPTTLRMDGTYYIIGEIRGIEGDLYLTGCERGSSGCLGTHHDTYAVNVPSLIARHVVDVYPNRNYHQELLRAAHNIDYVITMEELRDGSKKVTSVQEVRLNPYTLEIASVTIMEYDFDLEDWVYHADVDEILLKKMKKYDRDFTKVFLSTLQRLAAEKPNPNSALQRAAESGGRAR